MTTRFLPIDDPAHENQRRHAESVATIAADSHQLLVQADLSGKGHASIRNAAILRLRDVYGLDAREIAGLVGIRCSTVGNILARHDKKAGAN